jgi:hypothetical protein
MTVQGTDAPMNDEQAEIRMRLRRLAKVARLELELRGEELVGRNGAVVAYGRGAAIGFPLPAAKLAGLTGIDERDGGWTEVDAWQPELPAGEALQRLGIALRRAYARVAV